MGKLRAAATRGDQRNQSKPRRTAARTAPNAALSLQVPHNFFQKPIPNGPKIEPKWLQNRSPEPPGGEKNKDRNMKSLFCLPGGLPNRSRRPPEPKKIHGELPGRLRENFPARFHPPKGLQKPICLHFCLLGASFYCCFALCFGPRDENLDI